MITRVKALITKIIPEEHHWKLTLFTHWKEIIGQLDEKVYIQKIDGTLLILGVAHPVWAQELTPLTPILLKKINDLFPSPRISKIRFNYNPSMVKQNKKETERQDIVGPKNFPILDEIEKIATKNIANTDLQSCMEMFYRRCKSLRNKGEKR